MSPWRSVAGQPPSGGGHGGVTHWACAAGARTGTSCRSARSCSPDQVPVTVAQPSTRPSFSKRAATAPKSAPATRTAPFHTGLTLRSGPSGPAIGRAGSNQSPRSFRTSRPVAAARTPSRTTSPSTSTWPGNHAGPEAGSGGQNVPSDALRAQARAIRWPPRSAATNAELDSAPVTEREAGWRTGQLNLPPAAPATATSARHCGDSSTRLRRALSRQKHLVR